MSADSHLQLISRLMARTVEIRNRFRVLKFAPATLRNNEKLEQLISDSITLERGLREIADEIERERRLH